MTARRFAPLLAVALLVLFTTCTDTPTTVEPEGVQVPSVVRSDVQHAAPLYSLGAPTLETLTALYDQWTSIPIGGGSALGGCGGAGCFIADDFIVPAGETWYISQVRANGDRRGVLPFRIRFYVDNSDKPGALVFDADNLTDFVESPRGPTNSDFDINLGQAATLVGGGKYWLAIRTGTATTFEFLWGGTGPPVIPEIGTPSQESNGGTVWESSRGLTIRSFALFGTMTLPVSIEISPVNCNKPTSNIAVSILTTASFDATTVDHTTVTFEGASEVHVHPKTGEPRRHETDVDGDGDIDLLFHFRFGDTALTCESTEGTIEGETFGGIAFHGTGALTSGGGGGGGEKRRADLMITKSDQADPVGVGNNIVYTINVLNLGPYDVTDIDMTDPVPEGTTFVSATVSPGSCSVKRGTVTCNIPSLPSEVGTTMTLTVRTDQAGQVTNTATVKPAKGVKDPDTSNNSASEATTVN